VFTVLGNGLVKRLLMLLCVSRSCVLSTLVKSDIRDQESGKSYLFDSLLSC